MVENSSCATTRRMGRRLFVPHTRVWRTLQAEGMYPYHVQRVQYLRPGDFTERLEFCKWFNGSRELHRYILFTDESQFNHDGVDNTHRTIQIKGNFMKLTLHLYFKCIVYCTGLLFCSVYCQ